MRHNQSFKATSIGDIELTLGIDVNVTKVGKDLSEAIFAEPNNTFKFSDVLHLSVPVVRGMMVSANMFQVWSQKRMVLQRILSGCSRYEDRCGRQLSAGGFRDGNQMYVEQCLEAVPSSMASRSMWPHQNIGQNGSEMQNCPCLVTTSAATKLKPSLRAIAMNNHTFVR